MTSTKPNKSRKTVERKEIPDFNRTRADLPPNATKAERLHAKANELRMRGDSLSGGQSAEGKRLLRRCRRVRMKARAVERVRAQ